MGQGKVLPGGPNQLEQAVAPGIAYGNNYHPAKKRAKNGVAQIAHAVAYKNLVHNVV